MVKLKNVKAVVTNYMELAAAELEKMKLKKKPATAARKVHHGALGCTKEPCVFKAKPASKIVKCFPMKKFLDVQVFADDNVDDDAE